MAKTDDIKSSLDALTLEIRESNKVNSRIYKSIENYLELIYNDRDLIKDAVSGIASIKSMIETLDKHNETLTKSVEQKVVDTQDIVIEKHEEVKDAINET